MTTKKTTAILTIIVALGLFILTLTQFEKLFELLLPNVENLQYQTNNPAGQFKIGLLFSIVVGVAPVFLYLTWRLSPINANKKKILSGIIILGCMLLAIFLRQLMLKSTFNGLTHLKTQTGESIYNSFPIENVRFEYYLFAGLVLGCIVSFLTLKDKNLHSK